MIAINSHYPVKVIHGACDGEFDLVGSTVGRVRASLVDAFNIPFGALAFVNGDLVAEDCHLRALDILEFVRQWGRKGATDNRDEYFLNSTDPLLKLNEVIFRLRRLEDLVLEISKQQAPSKEFYTVEEFGKLVDLSPYTVREHCRLGRLHAGKAACGRGNIPEWRIPHVELVRYRNYGLLPFRKNGS